MLIAAIIVLVIGTSGVHCKTAQEWKTRIIYQLLTDRFHISGNTTAPPCNDLRSWCGGSFLGIEQMLDYVQGLGANAIWISPIVLNTYGGYHGYWAKNIYELETHFGTEDDLRGLISACHQRDIWVMVDVVPNHMGYQANCSWQQDSCDDASRQVYTDFVPFNESYHYHDYCLINWTNPSQQEIEICTLAYLPDLNQSVPIVKELLYQWIENLTVTFNVDGYRIDTARHIEMGFWSEYQARAGVFAMGEVPGENSSYVGSYQNVLDSVLNFPIYYTIRKVFNEQGSMQNFIDTFGDMTRYFKDVTVLGNFADNHDAPRFLNFTYDFSLLKNAMVYVLMSEGIPIIYYGTEQGFSGGGDPSNRESLWPHYNTSSEMYSYIQGLATYRLRRIQYFSDVQTVLCYTHRVLVFSRVPGKHTVLIMVNNCGADTNVTETCQSNDLLALNGMVYTNVFQPSQTITVINGRVSFSISNGEPHVYEYSHSNSWVRNRFVFELVFFLSSVRLLLSLVDII